MAFFDILIEKINLKLGFSRKSASHIIIKKSEIFSKDDYKKLKDTAENFKIGSTKGKNRANKTKSFIYSKYRNGKLDEIEKEDPILKLANSRKLIELIQKNFGIQSPRLHKANYWWIPPAKKYAKRDMSQKWHIDPEGNKVVKVFIYFHDVSDSCMQINPSIRRSRISPLFSKSAASFLHRGGYSKIEGRLSCLMVYKPFR
jgi:hypothetical protein